MEEESRPLLDTPTNKRSPSNFFPRRLFERQMSFRPEEELEEGVELLSPLPHSSKRTRSNLVSKIPGRFCFRELLEASAKEIERENNEEKEQQLEEEAEEHKIKKVCKEKEEDIRFHTFSPTSPSSSPTPLHSSTPASKSWEKSN